jgi:hypothetical protein
MLLLTLKLLPARFMVVLLFRVTLLPVTLMLLAPWKFRLPDQASLLGKVRVEPLLLMRVAPLMLKVPLGVSALELVKIKAPPVTVVLPL